MNYRIDFRKIIREIERFEEFEFVFFFKNFVQSSRARFNKFLNFYRNYFFVMINLFRSRQSKFDKFFNDIYYFVIVMIFENLDFFDSLFLTTRFRFEIDLTTSNLTRLKKS